MLSSFQKVELTLLNASVIAVTALSIGLVMMIVLTAFALTVTLDIQQKLILLKREKNERSRKSSRWRPLQKQGDSADTVHHGKQATFL